LVTGKTGAYSSVSILCERLVHLEGCVVGEGGTLTNFGVGVFGQTTNPLHLGLGDGGGKEGGNRVIPGKAGLP
jgi:hypothetical protein